MIVTFGDALVDFFALPRGASVGEAEQFVPRFGGAPANVAWVAARLGVPARFVGAVGQDAHGDRLVRSLQEVGADVSCVVRVPNRTGITFVQVRDDGARSFLFHRTESADMVLTPAHLEALGAHPLAGATWLQLSSSAVVREPVAAAARWMTLAAKSRGVALALDLNVRAHLWADVSAMHAAVRSLAAQAALVQGSEEDFDTLGVTPDAFREVAPDAVQVVTRGAGGATVMLGRERLDVPSPPVTSLDATGAGDAFAGTLLAALSHARRGPADPNWRETPYWRAAATSACRVASRCVTDYGATTALASLPRFEDLLST